MGQLKFFTEKQFTTLVKAIEVLIDTGWSNDITLGSAHPQGGNRMSDDPSKGAVNSQCEVHGLKNLLLQIQAFGRAISGQTARRLQWQCQNMPQRL
ncbi:MAG: hypothetical protein IPO92_00845 [Saprospiraceae bacterium]|nr:hypothetical protein [Saprospiraceae bacterium]